MKISVVVDCRRLTWTGIGVYLQQMVRILSERPDIELTCLGSPAEMRRFDWSSRVRMVELRSKTCSFAEQFELMLKTPPCDIYWAPHFNIPLLNGCRTLVTVHDVGVLAFPAYTRSPLAKTYARFMFSVIKRRAGGIIAISEFTAGEFRRLIGCDGGKMRTVPLGVDGSWFAAAEDRLCTERPYILYVGNVKAHKNLANLMKAFEAIAEKVPHDLMIIGKYEGFVTGDAPALARVAAHGQRVRLLGQVDDRTLRQYVAGAQMLVFPSFYEGFGLPALEAMACGCPVIASNVSALPEVCGDAALYCDPHRPDDIAARIAQLAGDARLRDELRRKGIERARLFTWEAAADRTYELMKEMVGRAR